MNWSASSKSNDRESELTDESPFPFGKYGPNGSESCRMRDVPASYLDWFAGQEWASEWPAVLAYVQRNRKAIDQDLDRAERMSDSRAHDEAWQPDPLDDVPY